VDAGVNKPRVDDLAPWLLIPVPSHAHLDRHEDSVWCVSHSSFSVDASCMPGF